MDTPVKSVSSASTSSPNPVAQFEDSPVFKYIDSFSPIKPLNRVQSFNMLSYASPKTSITSPATNCLQNSKKTWSPLSHSLKPEITDGGNKVKIQICDNDIQLTELVVRKADYMESSYGVNKKETHESLGDDPGVSLTETDHKQDYGESVVVKEESAVDEPAELSTGHGDPANSVSQTVNSELSPEFFIQRNSKNGESSFGMASQDGCRWGKASVEAADQLLCDSPFEEGDFEETDNVYVDSDTLSFMENVLQPSEENIDDILNLESPLGSFEEYDVNLPYAYPNAGQPSPCSPVVDEIVPNSHVEVHNTPYVEPHHLIPRRSLVYQVSSSSYRKLVSEASESSRIAITSEKQLVSSKCKVYNCSSELPGIGLHLNAFARSEKIVVKHEISTYKRQLITIPCTTSLLPSQSSDVKPIDSSMQNDLEPSNSTGKLNENPCQSLAVTESEKFKQNLNKKKRCISDLVEDNTCKRCNCKRSKCLKLYCECFAAGLYCVEPCSCQGCLNKPAFEETVLETRRLIELRNPLAFAPKVIRFRDEAHKTPASARHKRGCNCKKSGCLKKYCECFQGGVGCSLGCRCEGCINSFGRKHDMDFLNVDTEDKEETTSSQISRNPSGLVGLHLQFPSFSSRMLQPCANHGLAKEANISCNDNLETFKDENDVLISTSVKSVSPNSKRVSPTKLCRKLILRSISPFPELPDN